MRTKIAFLILAHDDPVQLSRLCRALGHNDDILVHLDARSPFSLFEGPNLDSNVRFVQRRVPVFWGDFSVVEATLILLEEAMQSKTDYLRLVLLSGSCYPIKHVEKLRSYFIGSEDHLDMKYVNILKHLAETVAPPSTNRMLEPWISAYKKARGANRFLKFFDVAARKSMATILKPIDRRVRGQFPRLIRYIGPWRARAEPWAVLFHEKFPELVPYVGNQFWAITPECAKVILQFVRSNPEFLSFHRDSWAPDEHFFHTIVGNSEFSVKADDEVRVEGASLNNLHAPRFPCATIGDLDAILASGKFFVRKVATGKSDRLLDYLDEHLLSAGT